MPGDHPDHMAHAFIAALLMVALGVHGASGVIAVLGVAAVVCVSSAVAGELSEDADVEARGDSRLYSELRRAVLVLRRMLG